MSFNPLREIFSLVLFVENHREHYDVLNPVEELDISLMNLLFLKLKKPPIKRSLIQSKILINQMNLPISK